MTNRQLDVLCALASGINVLGYAPTVRELCYRLDIASTNAMAQMLKRLERDGLVERVPKVARGLALTDKGKALIGQGPRTHRFAAELSVERLGFCA